ncbi:hypothetical protein ACFL1X_12900 [Candidatus Hydrogenedentota bacterium]
MKRGTWQHELNRFKEKEEPETVLLVAGSSQLIRIVVAWYNADVKRARRLTECGGTDDETIWQWLWENARYSQEDLMNRIPDANASTKRKVQALKANRVLYPDGTVNSYVEKYLREMVIRVFSGRQVKKRA